MEGIIKACTPGKVFRCWWDRKAPPLRRGGREQGVPWEGLLAHGSTLPYAEGAGLEQYQNGDIFRVVNKVP